MRIKKILSGILCLVFVIALFSFSGAAESDHFVAEDDEQDISVSKAVYAEQGGDTDKGIGDDISLDDMNTEDENEMPGAIPAGANMMQMMTLEDTGDDDNPIKGWSDLKTSHKFPEETGVYHVRIPKEGEENEDSYVYCDVSFIPSIEEGDTPFYIANGLYGKEEVYTIRENNIDVRADINEEDIYIEHSDLVEAGETRITFSEEYYNDTGIELSYKIFFEVDFYSLKVPGELLGTVRSEVNVNDSPFLGVYVDYGGQISTHYHKYWAAYIDDDIWNSQVEVNIIRKSAEDNNEPVAGVLTNIFYYWGNYCIFKPAEDWVTTDAVGKATFIIGGGGNLVERDINLPAPALYGKLVKELGLNTPPQYYTYPDLKDFKGIIKVKVVNTENEPLKGRTVQFWGGAKYDDLSGGITNEQGIAEIRYPSSTTSTDEKELTMTELPTFALKWNVTQVIDNPQRIVEGHKAPLYLSPEIKVSEGYSKNPYTEIRGVKLQVYDVDHPETTLIETSPKAFKEKYDTQRDIIVRGAHRAYIKISPQDLAGKRLGIRAVVLNKDEGAREEYQVRGFVEDPVSNHQLYVPKKEFTFAFVPLRVGAWENNSSISYGSLSKQKEFIRKIFPAPIKFVEKSPMFIAKPRFFTHDMYIGRIFRELNREQKRFPNKQDLLIGLTPSDFLGAAGLQDSGLYGMNWEFLGAAHGAVLVDPKAALSHTTIHEFIHTLGLSDVYPSDGVQLLSANGHDGTPINNVAGHSPANEPIMYDHAGTPWPTEGEYNALLEYATKPAPGKMSLLSMSSFLEESKSEVLLLSGSIEDVRANQRKVYFDPIIKHTGDVDESSDFVSNDYVIQTLASDGGVLSQYFFSDYEYGGKHYANFIANLPAANVEVIEIGKQEYGNITQVFQRYEYSANAPEVSLTGPKDASLSGDFMITWEASDVDGDALLSEIQVSSDSGNTWDTLAADIPYNASGEYSYTVNAETFPQGANYKFKVVVTDGMHSKEAVSDKEYTIAGYEQKPILNILSGTEATIQVNPGTKEAVAYFELGNSGKEGLNVEFSPDDDTSTFVSPLFIKEYTIYPGQNQLIAMPLDLPIGEAGNTFEETVNLESNDPDNPTTNLTIKINYVEDALKPELASFSTTPSDFSKWEQGSDLQVTFDAYAAAGQSGLEATVIIEDENGNEILKEQMSENYHKPGAYTYYWEPEDLSVGTYKVYFGLKDTETGCERDKTEGEYDFAFSIKAPNAPPVFEEPQTYENDLGVVKREETITIPYEVNDPDGDSLDLAVYSNLLEHGLKLIKDTGNSGSIEWTANVSGAHSIYLTATDPSENSAEVMFNIAEIEDLNLFTISLEANPTEAGQVYGNGLYNSGEYVTVEAVPGELYKFISWTDDDAVVTDRVYMFKATKDRELVANFEETKVFSYVIDNNEVTITGFDDLAEEDPEDIVIPNEIEDYPVTGINNRAFYSKGIKSVNLPETLINIGTYAFGLNDLIKVTIPNSVTTIGMHGFSNNALTKVTFPNSVTTIGDYAFSNNSDLGEVVIPSEQTTIGEEVFSGCSSSLIIYGVPGSTADAYAAANSITFRNINEYGGDIPTAKYAITVADVIGGTATVTTNPAASAEEGAIVTVNIASVQSGKQFKTITVIDADSNNVAITEEIAGGKYTFIMPAKPVTVNVELQDGSIVVPETYLVTLNGVGSGAAGAGDYAENDAVTINAGNRSGYTFNGWTSTDVTFANANAQTTTFTMPAKNVTVTATWKVVSDDGSSGGISGGGSHAQTQYPVISKSESAQKTNGKMKLSSQQAKAGDTVFITIEPDPGYENNIPTVLDQNGNLITVTQNSDGTYSFQMPEGGVGIDTGYTKINYYDDVDQNDWYDEAAWFCAVHGLMEGTGDRRFAGDADTTRAMLVAVLYRLSQSDDMSEEIFADVEEGKWYTEAITWAVKNNIVSGYGNGNFGPEDILTREQMVAILHKYSEFMGYDISNKGDLGAYHDADNISDWAIAEMQWAIGNGLIKGIGNNLVSPQTGANRAQFAVIMQRYYTDLVERIID
jgi:uncharacterized repeat protein (TIGR02543 family)